MARQEVDNLDPIEKFIIWAKDNGWTVKNKITKLNLPKDIIERYPNINQEYRQFLNVVENCVTPFYEFLDKIMNNQVFN